MKKKVFSVFSVAILSLVILLACQKEDDNGVHKTSYASQPGYGTGGNPNPNNNPSSTTGGVTTSTTGSTSPTYGSVNDGTGYTFTTSAACGSATMQGSGGGQTLTISFSAAPTAGTYTTVTSGATASQCIVVWKGGNALAGGTVTVTVSGGKATATLTNVMWGSGQLTGSLTCM